MTLDEKRLWEIEERARGAIACEMDNQVDCDVLWLIAELRKQDAVLRAASRLPEFVAHDACNADDSGECNCGLGEALDEYRAAVATAKEGT